MRRKHTRSYLNTLNYFITGYKSTLTRALKARQSMNSLSRSLNYAGHPVTYIPPNLTVSGSDGKWYIYRVSELIKYMESKFGPPDIVIKNKPFQSELRGKKGVIIFEVDAWNDASGHATLWDGVTCSNKCYFSLSKKVMLWELK